MKNIKIVFKNYKFQHSYYSLIVSMLNILHNRLTIALSILKHHNSGLVTC